MANAKSTSPVEGANQARPPFRRYSRKSESSAGPRASHSRWIVASISEKSPDEVLPLLPLEFFRHYWQYAGPLDAGYTESHRAYHTWEHVGSLLEKLSEFSDLSTRSDIIAVSGFWHDVVYRTQNQDGSPRPDYENVRASCELFRQYTSLSKPDADAVYDLIMATANHLQARAEKQYYAGFSGDLDLFLDLDLSSLASPWEKFVEDLARIRSEFSWASEVVFCSIQLQILENFAKEDVRLYRRAETSETWRDAARANLKRCVTELQKRIADLSSV